MWCPPWKHTGLKGNPVRVRNSTRCCNSAGRKAGDKVCRQCHCPVQGWEGRQNPGKSEDLPHIFGFGNKATYYHETQLRSAFRNRLGSGIDPVDAQPTVPLAFQSIRSSCLSRSVPLAFRRPGAIRAVFHRPHRSCRTHLIGYCSPFSRQSGQHCQHDHQGHDGFTVAGHPLTAIPFWQLN